VGFTYFGIEEDIERPLKIHCDNTSVVFFSKNDRYSKGARYGLKHLSVKEEMKKKEYQLSILVLV
jgi:hypothetical protein